MAPLDAEAGLIVPTAYDWIIEELENWSISVQEVVPMPLYRGPYLSSISCEDESAALSDMIVPILILGHKISFQNLIKRESKSQDVH